MTGPISTSATSQRVGRIPSNSDSAAPASAAAHISALDAVQSHANRAIPADRSSCDAEAGAKDVAPGGPRRVTHARCVGSPDLCPPLSSSKGETGIPGRLETIHDRVERDVVDSYGLCPLHIAHGRRRWRYRMLMTLHEMQERELWD